MFFYSVLLLVSALTLSFLSHCAENAGLLCVGNFDSSLYPEFLGCVGEDTDGDGETDLFDLDDDDDGVDDIGDLCPKSVPIEHPSENYSDVDPRDGCDDDDSDGDGIKDLLDIDDDNNGLIEIPPTKSIGIVATGIDRGQALAGIRVTLNANESSTYSYDGSASIDHPDSVRGCPNKKGVSPPVPFCKGYELKANIDLSTHNGGVWEPEGNFKAIFNGNGFTISQLKITSTFRQNTCGSFRLAGFFSCISGEVRNVRFQGVNVKVEDSATQTLDAVGTLSGRLMAGGKVTDVTVTGRGDMNIVSGKRNYTGGVVEGKSTILDIGGLIGRNVGDVGGVIKNSRINAMEVKSLSERSSDGDPHYDYVGGLVGRQEIGDSMIQKGNIVLDTNLFSEGPATNDTIAFLGALFGYVDGESADILDNNMVSCSKIMITKGENVTSKQATIKGEGLFGTVDGTQETPSSSFPASDKVSYRTCP